MLRIMIGLLGVMASAICEEIHEMEALEYATVESMFSHQKIFQDKQKLLSFENIHPTCSVLTQSTLTFEVKNGGILRVLSSGGDGTNNETEDGDDIEIEILIKTLSTPLILQLPSYNTMASLQLQRDGNVHININGQEHDVAKTDECLDPPETNYTGQGCEEFIKGHRRNDSSHLYVSGTIQMSETLENARKHDANGNSESNEQQPETNFAVRSECNIDPSENEEECSINSCNQRPLVSALRCAASCEDVENGNTCLPDSCTNKMTVCDYVQLKYAIQDAYIYLLDMIDLMDLCDNLYQNRVLDIGIYQTLFDMSFERVQTRNATRTLLLHLSKREVKKTAMLKSLNDSAHYQLIPHFFPSENGIG